jgi:hypothetical protein
LIRRSENIPRFMPRAEVKTDIRKIIERPIQFVGPMVCAILDGSKTQTRRPIVPEPDAIRRIKRQPQPLRDGEIMACKFGQVGNRLWLRERWAMLRAGKQERAIFAADKTVADVRWQPSFTMPRSACRVVLEIVSLRIERLTNITRDDARREGCPQDRRFADPIDWFRELWDGLAQPQHAWANNPWVWVIGFDVLPNS